MEERYDQCCLELIFNSIFILFGVLFLFFWGGGLALPFFLWFFMAVFFPLVILALISIGISVALSPVLLDYIYICRLQDHSERQREVWPKFKRRHVLFCRSARVCCGL